MQVDIFVTPQGRPAVSVEDEDIRICYNGQWIDFKNGEVVLTKDETESWRKREDMERFKDNGDTVTDQKTGLTWLKNANLCGKKTWAEAIEYCKSLIDGWRLPERWELESLLDFTQHRPTLPQGHPFIKVQQSSYYWSATTTAYNTYGAWVVYMGLGYVSDGHKADDGYVWPVRGGQSDIQ